MKNKNIIILAYLIILFSIFPAKAVFFIPDKILFNQFELETTPSASAVLLQRSEEEHCFMDARERPELLPDSIRPVDLDSNLILDTNLPTNHKFSEGFIEIEECTWEEEQNHISNIARINDYGYLDDIMPFVVLSLLRIPPGLQMRIKPLLRYAGIGCFYGTVTGSTTALISPNESLWFVAGFSGILAALIQSLTTFFTVSNTAPVYFIYSSAGVTAGSAALCGGGIYYYLTSKQKKEESFIEEISNIAIN